MAIIHKDMECPFCHQPRCRELLKKQPVSPQPHVYTVRGYRCTNCGKEYETEERVKLAPMRVKVGRQAFSEESFVTSLQGYAPKRLLPSDCDLVLRHTLAKLEEHAKQGKLVVDNTGYIVIDRETLAARTRDAFIEAARIERGTDAAERLDVAHIQYALATLGSGWANARQFLRWFRTVDHKGRRADDLPTSVQPPTTYWGVPSTAPQYPKIVVKNEFIEGKQPRTRVRERYEPLKLLATVQRAFRGRDNLGNSIEMYVLLGLLGQQVVRSSQLSALIAEALRAVDDIAYLRWVMAGKELDADTVFDEAVALITHPSPRLVFTMNGPARANGN